jgi:hypothetical protein
MPWDGILGWNAIRLLDLELSRCNHEVVVRAPVARAGVTINLFWLGQPLVNVGAGVANLDTGAMSSALNATADEWRETLPERLPRRRNRVWTAAGLHTRTVELVERLAVRVAGHEARFENIMTHPHVHALVGIRPVMVLGCDLAERARMRIDFGNGRFDLYPEDPPADETSGETR